MALSQVTGLCITNPNSFMKQCVAFGLSFECAPSWNIHGSRSEHIFWGAMLNGAVMIIIGIYNLLSYLDALPSPKSTRPSAAVSPSASGSSEPKEKQTTSVPKWATLNMSVYAIGTGLFAWVRTFFHVSRPLLLLAAIHNLCEWGFIVMWYVPNLRDKRQRFFASFCLVWTIMVLVTFLPLLPYGGFLEQVHGLVLDYAIPYTTYKLYYNTDSAVDNETKTMWGWAFFGSVSHILFTILPIILMNFFVLQNETFHTVLEILLFISSIVTMVAYSVFVKQYDAQWFVAGDEKKSNTKTGFIATNFKQRVCVAGVLGVLTLVGPATLFRQCNVTENSTLFSFATRAIAGSTTMEVISGTGKAFKHRLYVENYVNKARAGGGNQNFHLFQHATNPDKFMVVEKWASKPELDAWLAGPPKRIYQTPVTGLMRLFAGYPVLAGYTEVFPSTPKTQQGAVTFVIENSCGNLYGMLSDWNNCQYFVGCESVTAGKDNTRTLNMKSGKRIVQHLHSQNDAHMVFEYQVLTDGEVIEEVTVHFAAVDDKCDIVQAAELMTLSEAALDSWTTSMNGIEIPAMQAQLKA